MEEIQLISFILILLLLGRDQIRVFSTRDVVQYGAALASQEPIAALSPSLIA